MNTNETQQILLAKKILSEQYLNKKQLRIIRRLLTPEDRKGLTYSYRTSESILLGHRHNAGILYNAIEIARKRLQETNDIMNDIDNLLSSEKPALQDPEKYISRKGATKEKSVVRIL